MTTTKSYWQTVLNWTNNRSAESKIAVVGLIGVGGFIVGANYNKIKTVLCDITSINNSGNNMHNTANLTMDNMRDTPYYAVIFSSVRSEIDDGYAETASRMVELGSQQPGFLGVESARNEIGITISYWKDLDSIKQWKSNMEHKMVCFLVFLLCCLFGI